MGHKVFRCSHRVSYAECTVGNHLYHSRFLDILERGRGEFFRSLNRSFLELQEQGLVFPVTYCEMRFLVMARYDDVLTVELWLTELGRARFCIASRILDATGAELHKAAVRFACTNLEGRPCRLPVALAGALEAYLAPAVERGHEA